MHEIGSWDKKVEYVPYPCYEIEIGKNISIVDQTTAE